jgi:cyclic dehypoxanthinyl futalosine synthase
MMTLEEMYRKVREGTRLSREEGVFILRNAELLDMGDLANEIRFKINPKPWVTYLLDTNPNYSNICTVDCIFCAFYRHPGEKGAYRLSIDHLIQKFKEAASKGVTTVLLQGGVDPTLPFEYYLELVERTVKEVPAIYPHFFSTSEIIVMSQVSGLSIQGVLEKLWEKGLRSIPGGGAEILSDRVKKKISSKKGTSADWLNVMRLAQRDRKSVV